jgi:hypothetical protein
VFCETPLQLDDDEGEVAENPSEPEKKRGRNEENKNEEEEEKLKYQRVQNAEEQLLEKNVNTAYAPVVEMPDAAAIEEQRQDVDDGEEGCLYGCSEVSGSLVQCDRCEKWFHEQCAGYDCKLSDNPVYNGHPIELKAYCYACLDDMELSHADIVQQEREYLELKKFFERNATSWSWRPVPQNGVGCLSEIWSKHPGPFDSLERLISASATAAKDEVDKHVVGSGADKHRCKVVFGNLAKDPTKLTDMWPYLEVQCIWQALANSVFKGLKLKLHSLEGDGEEEIAQLRCIQSIPDDNVDREHTINLLQWNRKVDVHYDLIEEVVVRPHVQVVEIIDNSVGGRVAAPAPTEVPKDNGGAGVVNPPDVVADAAGAAEIGADSGKDGVDTGDEKIETSEKKQELTGPWEVGTLLEAEMMDSECPDYQDTIHPVEVVDVMEGGTQYRCQLLAFSGEQSVDVWRADFLHDPREYDENGEWKMGDKVHFRIRNRKVGKSE